jgi:hypothetical protein
MSGQRIDVPCRGSVGHDSSEYGRIVAMARGPTLASGPALLLVVLALGGCSRDVLLAEREPDVNGGPGTAQMGDAMTAPTLDASAASEDAGAEEDGVDAGRSDGTEPHDAGRSREELADAGTEGDGTVREGSRDGGTDRESSDAGREREPLDAGTDDVCADGCSDPEPIRCEDGTSPTATGACTVVGETCYEEMICA